MWMWNIDTRVSSEKIEYRRWRENGRLRVALSLWRLLLCLLRLLVAWCRFSNSRVALLHSGCGRLRRRRRRGWRWWIRRDYGRGLLWDGRKSCGCDCRARLRFRCYARYVLVLAWWEVERGRLLLLLLLLVRLSRLWC